MSYIPTEWKSGDVVTASKLNKLEQGVANGGGGVLVATVDLGTGTLDKTWQEIHDAAPDVYFSSGGFYFPLYGVYEDSGEYCVVVINFESNSPSEPFTVSALVFKTDSAGGYPSTSGPNPK